MTHYLYKANILNIFVPKILYFKRLMKILKIVLAVLLLLCLAHMPYGYYQLVRWAALVCFAFMGYDYCQRKNVPLAFVFFGLAVLFQPIVKIALGRTPWNIVDVVVAIFLVVLAFIDRPKELKEK